MADLLKSENYACHTILLTYTRAS